MSVISLVLAATLYTAAQGSAVQLKVADEPRTRSVQVRWQEKTVPAFRVGEAWTTLLGIDLDMKPGTHAAEAFLTMEDGSVRTRPIEIKVAAKKFPETRLTVAPKFTQLNKANQERADREAKEVAAIYERITTDLVPDEVFLVP